jgi:putative ABC transport system permease protein
MLVQGRRTQVEIVDVRPGIPGLTESDSFVVVPTSWLEHSLAGAVRPNVMWIRASEATATGLRDVTAGTAPDIEIMSRYEENAALRNQPLLGAVGAGFAVAFVTSVAYAVLTILFAVVLSMSVRVRDLAILRTLGLHRRQQTRLSMIEHVPPILVALPMGVLLGVAVAAAVSPALGLGALSGSAGNAPLVIDWSLLLMLSVGLLLLSLAAVGIGSWLARRAAIVNGLRVTSD